MLDLAQLTAALIARKLTPGRHRYLHLIPFKKYLEADLECPWMLLPSDQNMHALLKKWGI